MRPSSAAAFAIGLGYALLAVQAPLLTACRGGLDSVCHCASDCRAGLVCELEGMNALTAEMCFPPGTNGRCVEAQEGATDGNETNHITDVEPIQDLNHSVRDFAGGESNSLSGTTTGPTTDDSDSATGSSSSTGASTTGDTSTTGTTGDTSTGTTGTTGDTGTSSTGGSSSTGDASSSSSSSTT